MCASGHTAAATREAWPLSSAEARLIFLRSCCAVAEGAVVPLPVAVGDASTVASPALCVAAVLGDAQRRVAVLGGREGKRRSLGSVYGGSVTRYLGGRCRGVARRVIVTSGLTPSVNGVAVSRDGSRVLVSDSGGSHAIHEFSVADGSRLRVVGRRGDGHLQFRIRHFVFVADCDNQRVQVLTPTLEFDSVLGDGRLIRPVGVCANSDVVAVSEMQSDVITVLKRRGGALLHRIVCGDVDGGFSPRGLCFMSDDRRVAISDCLSSRVRVCATDGVLVSAVGPRKPRRPQGVACSSADDVVVADESARCVVVHGTRFGSSTTIGCGGFIGVAVHGSTIFALEREGYRCVVFE
jgi:sugar lactone lactonase YvrE